VAVHVLVAVLHEVVVALAEGATLNSARPSNPVIVEVFIVTYLPIVSLLREEHAYRDNAMGTSPASEPRKLYSSTTSQNKRLHLTER
jgi:hypothetical protein